MLVKTDINIQEDTMKKFGQKLFFAVIEIQIYNNLYAIAALLVVISMITAFIIGSIRRPDYKPLICERHNRKAVIEYNHLF